MFIMIYNGLLLQKHYDSLYVDWFLPKFHRVSFCCRPTPMKEVISDAGQAMIAYLMDFEASNLL